MLGPVALASKAYAYVPNTKSGDVWVIDQQTFQVVGKFPVGREVQHVVPSYDMSSLYDQFCRVHQALRRESFCAKALLNSSLIRDTCRAHRSDPTCRPPPRPCNPRVRPDGNHPHPPVNCVRQTRLWSDELGAVPPGGGCPDSGGADR